MSRFTVDELLLTAGSRVSTSDADAELSEPPRASAHDQSAFASAEPPAGLGLHAAGLTLGSPPLALREATATALRGLLDNRPERLDATGPPTAALYLQLAAALQAARQHTFSGSRAFQAQIEPTFSPATLCV